MGFGEGAQYGSFGRRTPEQEELAPPDPVMVIGEMRADLVLTPVMDPAALQRCGEMIASMVANAVRQGFDAGVELAGQDVLDDGLADGGVVCQGAGLDPGSDHVPMASPGRDFVLKPGQVEHLLDSPR